MTEDGRPISDRLDSTEFLLEVISSDEVLPLLLGVHIAVEHLLIECLEAVLPNPDALFSQMHPPYYRLSVALCAALGYIDDERAAALYALNALRNKYAHRLVFRMDENAFAPLFDAMRRTKPPLVRPETETPSEPMLVAAVLTVLLADIRRVVQRHKEQLARDQGDDSLPCSGRF